MPLQPGGLLFFDGLIHHGTPANGTDTRRRAIQFHYVDRNVFTIPEDDRLAAYGLEGRGVMCRRPSRRMPSSMASAIGSM